MIEHKTKAVAELLCFDKNEFMKTNFSVDEFLHKNRNAPSLEQLRDNLGLYLKGLRSSMIDLINEDYADFVSLSANLVGLDQSIDTIKKPLEQFRTDIESIQALIQDNENEMRAQLEQKRELRELRRNLQSLKKVGETMTKLEELLANQLSKILRPVDFERAALELVQLKFNEKFCGEYLKEEECAKIKDLEAQVHQKLRELFNEALKTATSTSSELLERCLRIYITLDACHVAETVFREDVIAPYMANTISEQNLQNSPQGLAGIYSKILNFISLHMTDILRLTQYTDKLRGFNFIVNSYWADVEMRLETHMSSIFAPGNSEVFYAKYKCTRDFLSKIEELLASEPAIQTFKQHKQTKSFHARWNLPVYFQICFQEIAGQFEAVLDPVLRDDILSLDPHANNEFQLVPFRSANAAIEHCWADGVYLVEVFPKFYKLNIQIVLRLVHWIADVLRLAAGPKTVFPQKFNRTQLLIGLHGDLQRMMALLLTMQQTIVQHIPKEKQSDVAVISDAITKSFTNLQDILFGHLVSTQECLVANLIAESGVENVRQVNDLPRLYRKTNRDVPTRSSSYVEQMLRPLKAFAAQQSNLLGQDIVEDILARVFSKITTDYYVAVSDVLTSVQKTEESLRRLRNLKSGSQPTNTTTAISDDDKIRLQLRVDVSAWTGELAKLNFEPQQIEKLLDLNNIVEESIKLKELAGV